MKQFLIALTGILLAGITHAQEVHFKNTDQKVMVHKGETVRIDVDTAYIISKSRAELLNEKLDELVATRKANEQLQNINQTLLNKVKDVENLVDDLLQKMGDNTASVNVDIAEIANQLDASLNTLKENNEALSKNNTELQQQISTLDKTIKKLKKEIRGIWWNGIADKIVTGAIGVGIGLLIAAL